MAIRIFIDQGHNPVNPNAGAEGNGLREQDLTYRIGVLLGERLASDPEFEVRLSRNTSTEQLGSSVATSLSSRVNAANSWRADYFISLHANASNITSASGCEGYAYSRNGEGFWLGDSVVRSLSRETGLPDRGMFVRPSLYVLRKTTMPATLIEMGFITNPGDAELMNGSPGLFADGIYNGILEYFGMLG